MTGRDAIKTIVSAEDDFVYITTNLRQYQDKIVDFIMYDLGDIISDKIKRSLGTIEFVESDTRSYHQDNVIGLLEFDTKTIYHEIGHCIEAKNKDIHRKCVSFLDKRTYARPTFKLRDYFVDDRYGREIAQPGGFINVYAGKRVEYDAMTEILSVGLEQFNTNDNILKFYEYDREYFELILDIIVGDINGKRKTT